MATDFYVPSNADLREVEQNLIPNLQNNREIFKILPTENIDDAIIMWEQLDKFIGLQSVRGYGGAPPRVIATGAQRWQVYPGVYGEFRELDEFELTTKRSLGTFGTAIDLSDMVTREQNLLLERELDVQEYIGWTLLTTGTFSQSNANGTVLHTDSYTFQTFTASVTWSTLNTSTPLADLRAIKLLHRGNSVSFGRDATCYLNQTWVNNMLENTNTSDLGGKRINFGNTILTLAEVNKITSDNDLPMIVPMDGFYMTSQSAYTLFIANATGVVIGHRTSGVPVGSYAMTRNANNPGMAPGPYVNVTDSLDTGKPVPRTIAVHRGHNGGPKIPFPASIVQMTL